MVEHYDEDLLLGYVEGELAPAQRNQIEQLIRKDPRLGQLLRAMVSDRAALRDLPDPVAPDWLMDEVDRQLERAMLVETAPADARLQNIQQRHLLRRFVLVGAVAASVAVVGTVVISSLTAPLNPPLGPAIARNTPPGSPAPSHPAAPASAPGVAATDSTRTPSDPLPGGAVASNSAETWIEPGAAPPAEFPMPMPEGAVALGDPALPVVPMTTDGETPAVPEIFAGTVPQSPELLRPPLDLAGRGLDEQRQVSRMLVMLPSRPELSQQLELRIVTREMGSTRRLLERLPGERGVLRSDDAPGHVSEKPQPGSTQRYTWRIPVLELPKLVQRLHAASWHTGLAWHRRSGTRGEQGSAPWPSLTPDYTGVVQQQIPPLPKPSTSSTDMIELSVVLEQAAPAESPRKR